MSLSSLPLCARSTRRLFPALNKAARVTWRRRPSSLRFVFAYKRLLCCMTLSYLLINRSRDTYKKHYSPCGAIVRDVQAILFLDQESGLWVITMTHSTLMISVKSYRLVWKQAASARNGACRGGWNRRLSTLAKLSSVEARTILRCCASALRRKSYSDSDHTVVVV